MTARRMMIGAGIGSALLLGGAYVFQMLGFAPCQLCLWQRWPHAVAIALGLVAIVRPGVVTGTLGALAVTTSAGIAAYHTGVERAWWPGPTSCSGGGSLSGMSAGDLLSTEGPSGVVMCDQVAWAFAGLSMASWNAVFSLALAGLWIAAAARAYPRGMA